MTFRHQMKCMALPGILGVGLLYLLPGCALFYYAGINNVFQKEFVGMGNLLEILGNPYFRLALKNTVLLLTATLALVLCLALLLSFPKAFFGIRFWGLGLLFLIPFFAPSVILAEVIVTIGGAWSPTIQLLALFGLRNTGAVLLLFDIGLSTVEQEVLEAARIDGAGRWEIFLFIQLPVLLAYLGVGSVFLIMQFFGIFRESYLLFGTSYPPDEVYLLQNYMHNHFLRLNYPYLAVSALLFTVLLVAIIALVRLCFAAVKRF